MVLKDNPNDDGIAKAIAEAAQEAELEHIAEVEEENKGVLANISMSAKMSQESRMESAAEMCRLQAVQHNESTHIDLVYVTAFICFRITKISKF